MVPEVVLFDLDVVSAHNVPRGAAFGGSKQRDPPYLRPLTFDF